MGSFFFAPPTLLSILKIKIYMHIYTYIHILNDFFIRSLFFLCVLCVCLCVDHTYKEATPALAPNPTAGGNSAVDPSQVRHCLFFLQ